MLSRRSFVKAVGTTGLTAAASYSYRVRATDAAGNYTTNGRYGSASVSGTIWLTQDRCNGTFFRALKDDVYVVAFAHPHKRHHLMQGQTILIPAP